MEYRVCMHYIIDIPDGEGAGEAEIAEDAQRFIDEYARESYCVSAVGEGSPAAGMGIECPGCGGEAVRIDEGDVLVCEKGRPLKREARYRCRRCGSTVVFLERARHGR